jgi:hypothetical protein
MIAKDEQKIMDRIRMLLAKANDPASSVSEREQYLDEANRRMAKHAIDQAMLDATRTPAEKRKPTKKNIKLYDESESWGPYFRSVVVAICSTNRCRFAWHHDDSITVVGMQEDVDWVEMLWLNTFLYFTTKINPRWDVGRPIEQNIFDFKHAGYKWSDIWDTGFANEGGMPDGGTKFVPNKCGYMKTMYHRECKRRGVEKVGTQTFDAYRLTFTDHFVWEVKKRLEAMADANKKVEDETSGSTVALFDMSKLIDEEFYLIFPQLHPEAKKKAQELALKRVQDAEKADAEFLANMTPAARKEELSRRLKQEKEDAKAFNRYYRNTKRTYDAAGASAGAQAGREVDLSSRKSAAPSGSRTELPR